VNAATPFGLLPLRGAEQLAAANAMDRKLLDSLISAGFELSQGPNGQGVLGLIYGHNATGYYFNAGASELIVDGTIKLRRGNVTGFTSTGVALADGSTIDADLVIFATGDDAADHLGEFAKVGEDHEFGRLWRRSGLDRQLHQPVATGQRWRSLTPTRTISASRRTRRYPQVGFSVARRTARARRPAGVEGRPDRASWVVQWRETSRWCQRRIVAGVTSNPVGGG
jgi:hypothetical protein